MKPRHCIYPMEANEVYFSLVRRHPLLTINNDRQYRKALAFLNSITAGREPWDLDPGELAYTYVLAALLDEFKNR